MTSINLQDHTEISNCEEEIRRYCSGDFGKGRRRDNSFRNYDCFIVPQDCKLQEMDIRVANRMQARISSKVRQKILSRRADIESALTRIPSDCDLSQDELPDALAQLFAAIMSKDVKLARATKILHKKRPKLIPILDSVIQKYAHKVSQSSLEYADDVKRAMIYCQVMQKELKHSSKALSAIQKNIAKEGIRLSKVRILDILIWKKKSDA